jgi:hypothetical protein
MRKKDIPLSEAALRLGLSWERAWRLVLTGVLVGQKREGKWTVSQASIDRFETVRRATDRSDEPVIAEPVGSATNRAT